MQIGVFCYCAAMDLPADRPTDIAKFQALLRASEARVSEPDAIVFSVTPAKAMSLGNVSF